MLIAPTLPLSILLALYLRSSIELINTDMVNSFKIDVQHILIPVSQ